LEEMAKGKSNKEMAYALEIGSDTVKIHITQIFLKLDVSNRTSAVLVALRHGWIQDDYEKLWRLLNENRAPGVVESSHEFS